MFKNVFLHGSDFGFKSSKKKASFMVSALMSILKKKSVSSVPNYKKLEPDI